MYSKHVKRMLDLAAALLALPFFVPLFIIIAILIKLEDNGPVFYNANRVGFCGTIFKMFKFRSMKVNAPDIRLEDGSTYNAKDDPRVTKIGKILRETSLDETPQLLNVLLGDMSTIGPRPDPPDWLDRYPEEFKCFLNVKPGITGYNQAYFRNEADGYQKMVHDCFYAKNISFTLDLKIMLKTIITLVTRKNTYKR